MARIVENIMERSALKRTIAGAALAAGLLLGGCASTERADLAPIDDARRAEHVASFDYVWETIDTRHWDEEIVGASWDEARAELRPRLDTAETDREARLVMQELLGRTGQSHFGIIPAETYGRLSDEGGGENVGIEARVRDDEALVVRLREGSPAYVAGVRPGWVIQAIGGRPTSEVIEAAEKADEESDGPVRAETTAARVVEARLSGASGGAREVTFVNGDGEEVTMDLDLELPEGTVSRFGNLPEMRVSSETRTLDEGIGYFRFSAFFDPFNIMPAYQSALNAHRDGPGFIIDLRGNPGGIITMAPGMAGWFLEGKGVQLGTMYMRDQELKLTINPRRPRYEGKVAVLIDELSASNAEILSGGLRDIGAARVFGNTTAGQVLPARAEKLPNGDGFLYAFADYVSASGQRLEGEGVQPNEVVLETREQLLEGRDPVLDAAVAWILEEN